MDDRYPATPPGAIRPASGVEEPVAGVAPLLAPPADGQRGLNTEHRMSVKESALAIRAQAGNLEAFWELVGLFSGQAWRVSC